MITQKDLDELQDEISEIDRSIIAYNIRKNGLIESEIIKIDRAIIELESRKLNLLKLIKLSIINL